MIFKRAQHDGLFAVVHRDERKTITFTAGRYETEDPGECAFLSGMGYDSEGDMPKGKRSKPQGDKGK